MGQESHDIYSRGYFTMLDLAYDSQGQSATKTAQNRVCGHGWKAPESLQNYLLEHPLKDCDGHIGTLAAKVPPGRVFHCV